VAVLQAGCAVVKQVFIHLYYITFNLKKMARKKTGSSVDALRKRNQALGQKLRDVKTSERLKKEIAKKEKAISGISGSRARKKRR
jgi:hypothetical protein